MKERVKLFTYISGHGATLVEPPLEDHINEWLSTTNGRLLRVSQSESERTGGGQHITVSIWYLPDPMDEQEAPF